MKDGQREVRNPIKRRLKLEVRNDGEVGKMKTIPQSQQNLRAQETKLARADKKKANKGLCLGRV